MVREVTKMNFHKLLLIAIVLHLLPPVSLGMQSKQDEPITLRGELVSLDAQVIHKKTASTVNNLTKEDFEIYENGVKQYITHFSQDKVPLSVIILVDVSGSVWPDQKSFERLRRGAREAISLLKPQDEVSLMQFAAKATLVQPFTRDRDDVVNALNRLDGRGQRGTAVDEGILGAAQYMRTASNPDSRRVIIALTDDLMFAVNNKDHVLPTTHTEDQAIRELYESGSVVCALLFEGVDTPPGILKRAIAKNCAEATGGITIKTSQDNIPARLTEIIERLRQRYTIGYSSTDTSRDGHFRKIKVTVKPEIERREGNVVVITRKGYYSR